MEDGKKAKCLSNMRQLGMATLAYSAANQQSLPPFATTYSSGGMTFWYLEIRPYLGATSTSFEDNTALAPNLPVFYCPSVDRKRGYPHTDYGANTFIFACPYPQLPDTSTQTKSMRIESPSKIVMYSEACGTDGTYPESSWQLVASFAIQNPDPWFPHRHGERVNMVFCDGHAESLPRSEVVAHFTNYFGSSEIWK